MGNKKNKYCIIVTNSFSQEAKAYSFSDYDKAEAYVERLYNQEIEEANSLNHIIIEGASICEGDYARIIYGNGDYTEIYLCPLRAPVYA